MITIYVTVIDEPITHVYLEINKHGDQISEISFRNSKEIEI